MSGKTYTENEVRAKVEQYLAMGNIAELYQQDFVGYTGNVPDGSKRQYCEIIAEILLQDINHGKNKLNDISTVIRKQSYKMKTHHGNRLGAKKTSRVEEWIAKDMFEKSYDVIGTVFDYQVPLKGKQSDKNVGKIDLISNNGNNVYLLELKREDNTESILRCVLEIYTYYKQLQHNKFLTDFYLSEKSEIIPAILVFRNSKQHCQFMSESKNVKALMKKLGVKIFTIKPTYSITETN